MAVPYTFGTATSSIPLSQLDSNFATVITLGNTAIQLGNTVTTLNNMTLANVTISSGNVTLTNVTITTANVTTANVVTLIVTGNETVQGNTTVTGTATAAKLIPTGTSVTGNGMYLPATNSVGISTAGINAVYIDASQNVGIGTSSPGAGSGLTTRLDVVTASGTATRIGLAQTGVNSAGFVIPASVGALAFEVGATERMRIDSSGNVLVTSAAGLGYGTGSGGTVTQATSKSTSVTLNKPTGQITMNNAALATNTTVYFNFNNSLISTTDSLIVTKNNTGSSNQSYQIFVDLVASGSAIIAVKNTTAGSLSEALLINFAIIKGATS